MNTRIKYEFDCLMKCNNNDYKKCLLIMVLSRLRLLISRMNAIIEFGPIERDLEILNSIKDEVYEIEKLLISEELAEISYNKKVDKALEEIWGNVPENIPKDLSNKCKQ